MVGKCANPGCGKPLHYSCSGRVYLFEHKAVTARKGAARRHQLEHYWLCEDCASCMSIMRDDMGVHVVYQVTQPNRGSRATRRHRSHREA